MKAYLLGTGVIFALIVVAHLARLAAEGPHLLAEPVFAFTSGLSIALSVWAWRLGRPRAKRRIGCVSVVVREYDEAIDYYTRVLGFRVVEDEAVAGGKRWVLVAPPGTSEGKLLLARAKNEEERQVIGRQAGGRVFLFLHTDNFERDHEAFVARGVRFCEAPREEPYGKVAVFEDLYGNRWDLLELRHGRRGRR